MLVWWVLVILFYLVLYYKNYKFTPAVRSKISSKLIFTICV